MQNINEETKSDWLRAKAYTNEYLNLMPEVAYGLKPTNEIRSFAEQMLHLTDLNYALAGAAIGQASPYELGELEKKTMDKSKYNITRIVLKGYDFVNEAIMKIPPQQLNEITRVFGHFEMSRAVALAKAFEHQTHHRGQTTVYLRLAGVTPPKEKLF